MARPTRAAQAAKGNAKPLFPCKAPLPPRNLKGEALREWKRVVPELERAGVISPVDRAILLAYCEAWGMLDDVRRSVAGAPLLVSTARGLRRNPLLQVLKERENAVVVLAKELGLSPSSRGRMHRNARAGSAGTKEPDIGDFLRLRPAGPDHRA